MILTFDEARERAFSKEWFDKTYVREDICTDEDVKKINDLVMQVGEKALFDYFGIDEDMFLQKEYMDDLIDYLNDLK